MALSKEEFKKKWETENGGGITFDDIANCAIAWDITRSPYTYPMFELSNRVLISAGCEKYFEVSD